MFSAHVLHEGWSEHGCNIDDLHNTSFNKYSGKTVGPKKREVKLRVCLVACVHVLMKAFCFSWAWHCDLLTGLVDIT